MNIYVNTMYIHAFISITCIIMNKIQLKLKYIEKIKNKNFQHTWADTVPLVLL